MVSGALPATEAIPEYIKKGELEAGPLFPRPAGASPPGAC